MNNTKIVTKNSDWQNRFPGSVFLLECNGKLEIKAERLFEINTKYFVYYMATTVLSIKQIQRKLFSVTVFLCSKKISYFLLRILKL